MQPAAIDQPLGAEHFQCIHPQRPAGGGDVQVFGPYAGDGAGFGVGRVLQQIHGWRANEAGHKGTGGPRVDLFGGAKLFHHASVHHDHALRQRHGLHLVVGDKQRRDAQLAMEFLNFQPGVSAQLGVQIRQRFIKQKYLWLSHDSAAHGYALALAA